MIEQETASSPKMLLAVTVKIVKERFMIYMLLIGDVG
jgi:hypothetical protein